MSDEPIQVAIEIMENEYRVSCPENEQQALLDAALYLNEKMVEIRDSGKVLGVDRIAVTAALNISHELLKCKQESVSADTSINARLQELLTKVETTLSKTAQMQV